MLKYIVLTFVVCPILLYSQLENMDTEVDNKYLEDQVYLGVNYNFMLNYPADVLKRNFSYGLQGGVIKDLPINNSRTLALGIGLGYAVNSYYSNLVSVKENGAITYTVSDYTGSYNRSKFETHSIELPLELRWRNSSANEYKFFRIYTGVKLGYNFSARSKIAADDGNSGFSNTDIEKFQYGLLFNLGYNTFNLHVYYSLNNFLKKDAVLDTGDAINIKPLRVGVIFYLL